MKYSMLHVILLFFSR